MSKIIHYCWFGGKPLPRLAKKCIKSWKKYLPDYEIKRWDESNFDVNITNFSKKAYHQKKWAFVADVARVYALKKYGGIYFDTDMIITKKIDFLLNNHFFVGWESEDSVGVGVLGSKKPNNEIIKKLINVYKELDFDINNISWFAIPKLLTEILIEDYGLKYNHLENQKLSNNICIYARDYFYPLSYNYKNNMFTNKTCMIHYYDASWITKGAQLNIKLNRFLGEKNCELFVKVIRKFKRLINQTLKTLLFPIIYIKSKNEKKRIYNIIERNVVLSLNNIKNSDYVVIYNPSWLGITNATKELFENILPIEEIYSTGLIDKVVDKLLQNKIKLIIFSGFAIGWENIAMDLKMKNKEIIIKVIWHGSNCMHIETYDWLRFKELFNLYKREIIDSICFVKKSMADFYKLKGYQVEFLMNNVSIDKKKYLIKTKKTKKVKVGLYASGDRWSKNFYNQLSAASLVKDVIIDCIPITNKMYDFAQILKVKIKGESKPLAREKLLARISNNDVNIYVTFTECAPLLPLESFELGVPCITGNNHHYWEDHELRKYVVVEEADNIIEMHRKIEYCLNNKATILKLYKGWKKKYNILAKKNINDFICK